MGEKELYVLEYVNEKINGNEDVKYESDLDEEETLKEIVHYLKRLLSKRYVIGKDWEVTHDADESNVISIDYKKLKIANVGIKKLNKKSIIGE